MPTAPDSTPGRFAPGTPPRPMPQQPVPGSSLPQQGYSPDVHRFAPVPGGEVTLNQNAPTGLAVKRRNPVAAWLGLPLITLGIYSLVWYYKIHREMAEFDRRRAVPVAGPMLILLLLGWTIVAPLVSFFNTGNRIANAQRAAGLQPSCSAGIGLLLCFFFGLQVLYYQSELNKIADAYGVPEGTSIRLAV